MMKKLFILCCALPLLGACSFRQIEPLVPDDAIALTEYLQTHRQTPGEYIRELAETDEPIFLYGTHGIQSEIEFLFYLVPILADMNRLSVGFWFLNSVDQEVLDAYFSGESNEYTAVEILFLSDPSSTGYVEYADFLVYLKEFVQKSPDNMNWMITGADKNNAEEQLFISYVERTSLQEGSSSRNQHKILLHTPLTDSRGKLTLPFQGGVYDLMIHDWPLYRYSGIPLQKTPFGNLVLFSGESDEESALREEFDGLILLGIDAFLPLTPIEGFINEKNAESALKSFPDQIIRKKLKPASYMMNLKLRRKDKKNRKQLSALTEILLEDYPSE